MSKKVVVNLDKEQLKRLGSYERKIEQLYNAAISEAAQLGLSISDYNPDKPFQWKSYPQTKDRIDKITKSLYENVDVTVNTATRNEWLAACLTNDKIVKKFFSNPKLKSIKIDHYYQRNLEALESFQKRKAGGLNLSQRIWNQTAQFKTELEMCLDLGLSEGKSAAELSKDIRKYLNKPNQLYRRIADKESGQFYLSKNAKRYNPGQGQYRSSYKNALRLTRTETNMAYRTSDYERWQQLDFVVGYEVKRSNHEFDCPICSAFAGKYPITFKFASWHPNCLCYAVPILATPDEFIEYQEKLLNDEETTLTSKNEVSELPDGFKDWMSENQKRIDKAKSIPYFIKDNKKIITNELSFIS